MCSQMKVLSHQQPQSLLFSPAGKKSTKIKVYFQQQSKIHKVTLEADELTTVTVITMAIDKLNDQCKCNLNQDFEMYELFAAKKDGSKDDGLPALENNQLILKTQIKRFYLAPLYKLDSLSIPIETKDTISSIKSEINVNSVCGKENIEQKKQKQAEIQFNFCGFFCFKK